MSRKPEVNSLIPILIELILAMTVYFRYDTHTSQEPASLFWYYAVMNCLRFTRVRSFACRGSLRNLGKNCSTIALYCV